MELKDILQSHDLTRFIEYNESLGRGISRAEFKSICQFALGQDKPKYTCSFMVRDTDTNVFKVFYSKDHDEFYYIKMTRKKV